MNEDTDFNFTLRHQEALSDCLILVMALTTILFNERKTLELVEIWCLLVIKIPDVPDQVNDVPDYQLVRTEGMI